MYLLQSSYGTQNTYSNKFVGVKRIKFNINVDGEETPSDNATLVDEGLLTENNVEWDSVLDPVTNEYVPVIKLKLSSSDISNEKIGFEPGVMIKCPNITLDNNVSVAETVFNSSDNTGTEINQWNVNQGIIMVYLIEYSSFEVAVPTKNETSLIYC